MARTSLTSHYFTVRGMNAVQKRFNIRVLIATAITLATMGMGLGFPVAAQVASEADPLEDFQTEDGGSDVLSGNTQQGIQDLIHQINLSTELSMEEFAVQRQENILSEADRFRQLQRDRINQESVDVDADIELSDSEAGVGE